MLAAAQRHATDASAPDPSVLRIFVFQAVAVVSNEAPRALGTHRPCELPTRSLPMKPSLRSLAFTLSLSFAASVLALGAWKPAHEASAIAWAEPPLAKANKAADKPVAPEQAVNPVQSEMRILHEATRDWVTAVANNTLSIIPASIGKVHGARLMTEKAVEAGTYRPPKNGDALADFVKQDEAFHAELVKLLRASKANDLPGTTKQLGVVLDGCTSCHLRFRF